MKKTLFTLSALALCSTFVTAQTITPTRVGPVSQYGELLAGKNSSGKGQIYGSCQGVADGAEVQVKGMSLYWSLKQEAVDFWSAAGVQTMVNDMNIQIVRASMATGTEDWSGGYKGYASDPNTQKNLVKTVVEAAIAQDIYVIIDWHSHEAHNQTESAKQFFAEMAQTYGQYDNVIFEIYNEPMDISWDQVKNYANQVIPVIRQYSDNLILVGNPKWDQNPQMAINNEVSDPAKNTAYTLHYYANSHCWSGTYDWGGACEGTNGLQAMNAGLSIFMSEWGTGDANGGGSPDVSRNQSWQNYMNQHKISWANWSASRIEEGTAAFTSGSTPNNLQYTTSGQMVKGFLASNPTTYTACGGSVEPPPEALNQQMAELAGIQVSYINQVVDYTLPIDGFTNVEVFDVLGNRHVHQASVLSAGTHALSVENLQSGAYLVRIRQGQFHKMIRILKD